MALLDCARICCLARFEVSTAKSTSMILDLEAAVFSDVMASSRLAMDKHRAKKAFKAAGLLTPRGTIIRKPSDKTEDQWTTTCEAKRRLESGLLRQQKCLLLAEKFLYNSG